MLCTNSNTILNSIDGRITLNFKPSSKGPTFDPNAKNLVIVWDILMQNYRCINCDNCDLIATIPAGETFWTYFKNNIMKMSTQQKMAFMDS